MAIDPLIAQGMQPFNAASTLAFAEDIKGAKNNNALMALQLAQEQNPQSFVNRARELDLGIGQANLEAAQLQAAVPKLSAALDAMGAVKQTIASKGVAAGRQRLSEQLSFLQSQGLLPKDFDLGVDTAELSDDDFVREIDQAEQEIAGALSGLMPQTPDEGFTLSPGQARFEGGEMVASLPAEPETPEPDPLSRKLGVVRGALGRDLTEAEILEAAGISGQPVDNVLTEQIPPTQLSSVRLPSGESPPIGTTWGDAQSMGARVYSASELNRKTVAEIALKTLDELERMALDPETGVFVDEGGSFLTNNALGRLVSGISNGLGALAGTEASERRAIFDSTSRGVLSSLVRSMGESGALSDGDVQRANELIPTLGAMPDTERKAKQQFSELRTILSRGQENLRQSGAPEIIDYGDGVTLEILD